MNLQFDQLKTNTPNDILNTASKVMWEFVLSSPNLIKTTNDSIVITVGVTKWLL